MDYSILIPVYNSERYLTETVATALAQQGDCTFEIILVEDGSPDGSGAICRELEAAHPQLIRYRQMPHQGTVRTRRAAIAQAKGDYLVWLDADDLLDAACLQTLQGYRQQFPAADIILYEMSFFQEENGKQEHRPPLTRTPQLMAGPEKETLYRLLIEGNRLDSLCIKAIRRELMQEDPSDYGACADNPYGEDVLHCLYPISRASQVLLVPEELYRYRIHAASVMHVFDEAKMHQRLNKAKWDFFQPFMQEWGLDDAPWQDRLHAAGYKGVLDAVLHLWSTGADRTKLRHFVQDFVRQNPELKALSRSPHLGRKLRFQLAGFARGQIGLLQTALRLYKIFR